MKQLRENRTSTQRLLVYVAVLLLIVGGIWLVGHPTGLTAGSSGLIGTKESGANPSGGSGNQPPVSSPYYSKVVDDPAFDVTFTSNNIIGSELMLRFYHDSATAQPVWIEGITNYILSTSTAAPYESITLRVALVNGAVPHFRLHVGATSEVFAFGTEGGEYMVQETISGCANLSTPNTIYNLTSGFSSSDATSCINITANNVTLDCKGYTISGPSSVGSIAIRNVGYNLTTIRNCQIQQFYTGISFTSANFGNITNNTITAMTGASGSNGAYGSGGSGSYGTHGERGTGGGAGGVAISLTSSKNNTFKFNTITGGTGGTGGSGGNGGGVLNSCVQGEGDTYSYSSGTHTLGSGGAGGNGGNAGNNGSAGTNGTDASGTMTCSASGFSMSCAGGGGGGGAGGGGGGSAIILSTASTNNSFINNTITGGYGSSGGGGGAGGAGLGGGIGGTAGGGGAGAVGVSLSSSPDNTFINNTIVGGDGKGGGTGGSGGTRRRGGGGGGAEGGGGGNNGISIATSSNIVLINNIIRGGNGGAGGTAGSGQSGTPICSVGETGTMLAGGSGTSGSAGGSTGVGGGGGGGGALGSGGAGQAGGSATTSGGGGGGGGAGDGAIAMTIATSSNITIISSTEVTGANGGNGGSGGSQGSGATGGNGGGGGDAQPAISFSSITNGSIANNIITGGTGGSGGSGASSGANGASANAITLSNAAGDNVTSNRITTTGTNADGISLTCTSCVIELNNISTSGTSGSDGIFISGGSGNNLSLNNISTGGTSDNRGILLSSTSGNNLMSNRIATTGTTSSGINLTSSSGNNLSSNNITTTGATAHGIHISASSNNTFIANRVNATDPTSADWNEIGASAGNTAINLTLMRNNVTISFTDFRVSIKAVNRTEAPADLWNLRNITRWINATNNTATSWLFINFSYSDAQVAGLNESALRIWKRKGDVWSFVQGSNGVDTVNNVVYANITDFGSTFAPLAGANVSSCINIASPGGYVLNNSINSSGTCISINANNVLLDCAGYTINYSQSSNGIGVNLTNRVNVTIKNCRIIQTNAGVSCSQGAILFESTNDTLVQNNTIATAGVSCSAVYMNYANRNTFSGNNFTTSASGAYGFYLSECSNTNISATTIVTSGSDARGITTSSNSHNNTFANNNITTLGASAYGIRLYNALNNIVSENNITANATGIYLEIGVNRSTISNNIIRTNGTGNVERPGIDLESSSNNNTLTNNTIFTNGPGNNRGIQVVSSSYNNLTGNNISTNGTNNYNYGILIGSSSNNNMLTSNVFSTAGSSNANYGVYLQGVLNNNIINNTIRTNGTYDNHGIYLSSNSNFNNFTGNNISTTTNTSHGILIGYSSNNTFVNNRVNVTNETSSEWRTEFVAAPGSANNTATNLTLVRNGVTVSFTAFNGTSLKALLPSEAPTGPTGFPSFGKFLNITNTSAGAWMFLNVSYNDSELVAARIMNESNLRIWRYNGTVWENSTLTSAGVNAASNYVYANITTFSPFGVFESVTSVGNCTTLAVASAYTLNQSVNSSGTCMNINASNVVLDCAGYTITYGTGGGDNSWGVNVTARAALSNVAIKNCIIQDTNSSGSNGYGVQLFNTSLSIVQNNTIRTNGTINNYGIYLYYSSNSNNLTANNISTDGTTGNDGIRLDFLNRTIVSDNTITTTTNNSQGIYIVRSSHNLFIGNLVNVTHANSSEWTTEFLAVPGSTNNTAINLTLMRNNVTVSLTAFNGTALKALLPSEPNANQLVPSGQTSISKFVNATNNSANSWLYLNVSYSDGELGPINESTLKIWKYNASGWNSTGFNSSGGVDITNNVVYSNITNFASTFGVFGASGGDTTPPVVTIVAPGAGSWQRVAFNVTFNATDETTISTCWYQVRNGSSASYGANYTTSCGTGQNATVTVGAAANCTVQNASACGVKIWANDTSGNNASVERNFSIDYTAPTAAFVLSTPPNNTWLQANFTLNATFTNLNLSTCMYQVRNSTTNTTPWTSMGNCNGSTSFTNLTNITVGSGLNCNSQGPDNCTVLINATDQAGNSFVNTSVYTIDWTVPTTALVSPIDGFNSSNSAVTFNCSATDNVGLANITLYGNWSGGWHLNETVALTGTANWTTFTKTITDGKYKWNCLAYDGAGKSDWGDANRTFTVDTVAPTVAITTLNYANFSTATPTITGTASDATSGVRRVWASVDSGAYALATGATSWTYTTSSLGQGLHNITAKSEDWAGNNATSLVIINFTVDTAAPQWSSNATNSTVAGASVLHSAYWTDNIGLSGYIFSFDNCTGTLVNGSFVAMTGTTNWSNVTKTINSTVGCTIRWRVYANDTAGNWNNTDVFSYNTTTDITPPSVFGVRPAPNSAFNAFDTIEIAANATDTGGVAGVSANITYPNSTVFTLPLGSAGGGKYNASFTIPALSGLYNITYIANDTTGNLNASVRSNFTAAGVYSVNITAVPSSQTVAPDENATYTIIIGNNGSVNATYNLTRLNTTSAPDFMALNQTNITLAIGATGNVILIVGHVAPGQFDVAVTALLATNSSVNATVLAATTVAGLVFVPPTPPDGTIVTGNVGINVGTNVPNVSVLRLFATNDSTVIEIGNCTGSDLTDCPAVWQTAGFIEGAHIMNASATTAGGNNFSSSAITIYTDNSPPIILLGPPENGGFTNTSPTGLTCNGTESGNDFVNVTLWGNFSGSWAPNTTVVLSGLVAGATFDVTLPDGSYLWNCRFVNNISQAVFAWANYTFTLDTVAPAIAFVTPPTPTGGVTNVTTWTIQVNTTETYPDVLQLIVNDTTVNTTAYNAGAGVLTSFSWTFAEGPNNFSVIATDLAGSPNQTDTRTITIDTIAPTLAVVSPQAVYYSTTSILVNISSTDANPDKIWFYNGTANETYTGPVTRTFPEGSNTLTAWANDTFGHVNETSVIFIVDLTPSVVAITALGPSSWQRADFDVTYDATDPNIDQCWYAIRDGSIAAYGSNVSTSCGTGQDATITVGIGANCTVQGLNECGVRVWANDTTGTTVFDERNFSIDYTPPTSTFILPLAFGWQWMDFTPTVTDIDTGGSGLASCWYNVTDSVAGVTISAGRSVNATPAITVGPGGNCQTEGFGACTILAWCIDVAGNVGT